MKRSTVFVYSDNKALIPSIWLGKLATVPRGLGNDMIALKGIRKFPVR